MKRLLLLIFSLMLYVNGWGQCNFNQGNMNLQINGGGSTICPYESITVDVTGAPSGSTYLWSTGATTASISVAPATTTTYTVTVTCSLGNTATQSITANVSSVSVGINAAVNGTTTNNPSSITINCGQSVTLTATGINGGGGGGNNPYDWLNPNQNNQTSVTINPTATTSYYVLGTNNNGCKDTDTIVVNVNPINTASFTFSPNNACSGTVIQFLNQTAGNNNNYSWNFNDGTPNSNQQNPSHVFNWSGTVPKTYNVTLTVTPSGGGGGSGNCPQSVTLPVNVLPSPDAGLIPIPSWTKCSPNSNTQFNLTVSNNTNTSINSSYTIIWGDGSANFTTTTNFTTTSHTYNLGTFNLIFIVTSANGCADTAKYLVQNITNPNVGCNNVSSTVGCAPATFVYSLSGYANNDSTTIYVIDYGDGSPVDTLYHNQLSTIPASGPIHLISHTYLNTSCGNTPPSQVGGSPNTFTFLVQAITPCFTKRATIQDNYVYTSPQANFTINKNPACINTPVTITNTTIAGYGLNCDQSSTFLWDFGDGSTLITSNNANVTHTYTTVGTYIVSLTADNGQCPGTTFVDTICIVGPPIPAFTSTPSLICAPDTLFLNNTSTLTTSCDVPTYNWTINKASFTCPTDSTKDTTFVNNTSLSSFNPNVIINNQGIYNINLSVTNVCGTYTAPQQSITVKRKPIASINVQPSICVNQSVNLATTFQGCGDTTRFYWTIPGGSITSSTAQNPGAVTFANPGTYIIKDSVVNSCGAVVLKDTLVVYPLPVPVVRGDTICVGQQAVVVASGGTSYLWSNGSTNDTLFVSPASTTTYTVTVTNANSCSATATTSVLVNPLPTPVATGSTICSGLSTTITGSGGGTYLWSTGATTQNINVVLTATATYTLTVTNSFGCTASDTAVVTIQPLPLVNAGPSITLCNQPIPTTLTGFSPTGGTWSGTGVTSSGVFTPIGTGVFVLTYTFTDSNGCINNDTMRVTVIIPQVANAGTGFRVCQSNNSVNLTGFSPAGGTWSGTNVTSAGVFTPSQLGLNVLTFSYGAGTCLNTDTIQVTVDPLPVPIASGGTLCSGQPFTILGSGGGNYLWSSGATTQNINVTLTTTNTYTLTVTNNLGCTASDTAIVTILPLPLVNAGPSITLCNQPIPTTLSGYSPNGGLWSGIGVSSAGIYTPNGTGNFVLTYTFTDANGCTNNDSMLVTVITPQLANAGTGFSTCQSNTLINLLGFSPAGGLWSGNNVTSAGAFTPTQLGQTILTYSYGSGTCSNTDTIQIVVNPLPIISSNSGSICPGGNITLTASGGVSYSWNTTPAHNYDTLTVSPIGNTNYIVTGTDANGCINKDTSIVSIISAPLITNPTSQSLCSGSNSIPVQWTSSLGPTSTYNWTLQSNTNVIASSGTIPINGTGNLPSMQLATTGSTQGTLVYTATATGNGCTGQPFTYTINVNPLPNVNAGSDKTICSGLSMSLNGSSTTASASYAWSPSTGLSNINIATPSVTLTASTATTNIYVLTVTDGNNCTKNDTVIVNVNPLPTITSNSGSICPGGSITLTASGGVSYSWNTSPVQTTDSIIVSPTTNTNYVVTGTDSNGCINKDTSVVSIISAPSITNLTSQSLCSESNSTSVQWTSSLGPTSTYIWTLQNNTNVVAVIDSIVTVGSSDLPTMQLATTGSVQGTLVYTATATGNGCTGQPFTYTIYVNPLPNVNAGSDKTICSGLSATLNGSSTTASASYAWSPSTGLSSNSVATPTVSLTSGTAITNSYVLTVTDGNTCTKTDTVLVNVNPLPTISSNSGSICPGGSITLTASGGVSYSWNTTPLHNYDTLTVSPLVNTIYIVTGTDANGCTNKDTSTVSLILAPIVTSTSSQTICSGDTSSLVQWTSSLGPGTTYSWVLQSNTNVNVSGVSQLNGTGSLLPMQLSTTGNTQGVLEYVVTPTGNGCTGRDTTYKILVNPLPNASAGSDKTICSGLSATLNGSSTTASASYLWSPSTGLSSNSVATPTVSLTAGTAITNSYVLTVTDGNTCTKTDTVLVNVNPLPTITSNSGSICPGGSITLTASGGVSYSWNTTPIQTTDSIIVSPTTNSNYEVTGTDSNGCINKDTSIVNIISAPSITSPISDTICSETNSTLLQWTSNLGVATVYNWTLLTNTNVAAVTGTIPTIGTGDLPSMQLSTLGSVQGTLVYTATATGNGCVGLPFTYTIYVTPLPILSVALNDTTICSSDAIVLNFSSQISNTTYQWTAVLGDSISIVPTIGTGSTINQTLTNNGTDLDSVIYTITPRANNCDGLPINVTVYVQPVPHVTFSDPNQVLCDSSTTTSVNLNSTVSNVVYSWSLNANGITGFITSSGAGTIPSETIFLPAGAITNVSAVYTANASIDGCPGPDSLYTVMLYPIANITGPNNQTICSGQNIASVNWQTNVTVPTTYNWQIMNTAVTNVNGYSSSNGFGNVPAWTLNNPNPPNPNPDSLIIQVIPYTHPTPTDSCQGIPYIYTIVVNPAPSVNVSAPNDTICSGDNSQLVQLSSATNNISISWVTVVPFGINGLTTLSGTTTIPSENLINTTPNPISIKYTIRSITTGSAACPGVDQYYYVVVNPSPLVTFNQPNQVICSGSSTVPVTINTTSPNTIISWSCNPPAFITGLTSTSGNDTIPSFNLVNNSFNPITITFAAWGTTISESCVGDTSYYTITVNPIPPAFASPSDTTICSNTAATIQLSSPVPGTTFSWTFGPNPFITGASNGNGNTITQTLVNSDVIVQTMTYYITPNASNCPGSPITANVNVNPAKPVVFNPGNQSLCSNETSIPVYLSSPIDSVTFSWTCTPPAGITGTISSGTDSIPSQNLFSNSTVVPIPVIYNAIATYDGCPGPVTPYTITVNPTPVPSFTLDTVICKNVSYVFGNTTSTTASTTYTWDFGDGANSTATSPSHAYTAGGVYTITLVATNQYGCDSTYIRTVRVVEPPVAQFVESPREGCGPLSVTFTDQSTGYLINPTYNWNFGNGTTANTQGPHTVIYNASLYQDTLYLVTQTVGNLCGSTTYIDSVIVHPTPTAYFGTNLSSGCSPLTISFSNNSYGLPTSFLWNFGDGTTDTSRVPAPHTFYAYTQDTIYYISLIAINDCGTNTYVDSILVHPNTTNAFFNTSPDRGCAPLTVTFTNFSTGGSIYAWDFGDGNVSNQYNTTHTYVNPGTYTASFIITNNCSYDTAYVSIEVWPQPTLSFTNSVDTVCINSSVQFTNTSATPLTNIIWNFGDGSGSTLSNPLHTYNTAGTFLVSMIGTGGIHGCSDTAYKYIVVKPLPIAAYDSLYFEGCQPFVANFINQSTGGVSGVLWDFGDGNTSAAFNATHVYLNSGIFYPLLSVQTQYGCIDTARGEVIVHPKPTSIFTFSPDSSCGAPVIVQFNNQSILGSGASWSFTDGQTSTQISPAMNFTQVGNIGVQLIAISDFGCKDTSADQFVVYPEPIADIAVINPRGCEDFTPVFINNSTNAISYLWTFGDGFMSTDQTPIHTYTDDGNYTVTLSIEGLGGCKDSTTLSSTITVIPGPTADFSYTAALNPSNYGWVYFTNLSVYDVSWHWDFDDNSTSTLENPDHQFNVNGVYDVELIAYAANGCTDTVIKPIKPTYFDGLFVPNAFAPDKGTNGEMYRVFYPQGKSLSSYHVWVYDMFGILIWESTALKDGSPSEWWDGTRDGSPLPSDVYIWKIEATFENGEIWPGQFNPEQGLKRITGNVTLIR